MFAAQGAAELPHQVADLFGDGHHGLNSLGLLEVDQGADVQAADAGVAVVSRFGVVAAHDFIEPGNKGAQVFRVYGGVFHERQGLGVAVDAHQQPQTRFAHVPDRALGALVQQVDAGVTQLFVCHVIFERVRFGRELGLGFAVELHRQQRAWVTFDEGQIPGVAQGLPATVQQYLVHYLNG